MHLAHRKDGQIIGVVLEEFDGGNDALGTRSVHVNQHNLGAQILELSQDRVGCRDRETDVAEYDTRACGGVCKALQITEPVSIVRQEGDGYAVHSLILDSVFIDRHVMRMPRLQPDDFGNLVD
jgi:hypothetical protein